MSRLVLFALVMVGGVLATVRLRLPRLTAAFAALLLGPALYFVTGREIARAKGEGQFYSVPFGGYGVGDAALLGSLAVWVVGCGLVAWAVARLAVRPR